MAPRCGPSGADRVAERPIHVAFATDDRFAADAAVLVSSLVSTNDPAGLHVILLHGADLSDSSVHGILEIGRRAGAACTDLAVDPAALAGLPASERFPVTAWYRILLPQLLPQASRALYLDVDTLVVAPLAPLWDCDLDGMWLGAVTNPLLPSMEARVTSYLGLPSGGDYFNSGVLLLDLEAFRAHDVAGRVAAFVREHPAIPWPDQDALNGVLHEHRLALHPRWNAMPGVFELPARYLPYPREVTREAADDPAIVHFVGPHKPWHHRSRHPYRREWFRHLDTTPWAGRPIEGRSATSTVLRRLPGHWALHLDLLMAAARERGREARSRVRDRLR